MAPSINGRLHVERLAVAALMMDVTPWFAQLAQRRDR